jgi:amino acid adenylation domain-containing protein
VSIEALVTELVDKNIHLWLEEGKLKFRAPKAGLPDLLRQKIVQHRAEIIDLLRQQQARKDGGLVPVGRGQPLPLSLEQERLWFLHQLYDDLGLYNMAYAFEWRGPVQLAALDQAMRQVIERHEILRTRIEVVDGSPRQVPMAQPCWELAVESHPGVDAQRRKSICQAAYEKERGGAFDLACGEVMRTRLLRFDHDAVLIFAMDHIVSDAWSQNVLIAELYQFYLAAVNNAPLTLPPLPVQYADYAVWQRQRLSSGMLQPSIDFWRDNLDETVLQTRLPTDGPRPAVRSFRGASVAYECKADTLQRVKQLCERLSVTVSCVLLSTYALLVARQTWRSVVAFGVPTAGREQHELQGLIGFFVNAVICRIEVPDSGTVGAFIQSVQRTLLRALEHQQIPIEHLADILHKARGGSEHLDIPMAFNYVEEDERATGNALSADDAMAGVTPVVPFPLETGEVAAKHELTLALNASATGLRGSVEYNTDLFSADTIARFLEDFDRLLNRLASGGEQAIQFVSWYDDSDVLRWLRVEHPDASLAFPLSPAQRDIYFSEQLNPSTQRNNLGYASHILKPVDEKRWRDAVGSLVKSCDMLRVHLHRFKDSRVKDVYQWLSMCSRLDYSYYDWAQRIDHKEPQALNAFIEAFIHRSFDLQGGLLHRHALIKLADDHYISVLGVHHVLFDGVAVHLHAKRLADIYLAESGDVRRYRLDDFQLNVSTCRATMDTPIIVEFWARHLTALEPLQVPALPAGAALLTQTQAFDKAVWGEVKRYCRRHVITPMIFCKGIYGLLIQYYFQAQTDFVITEFIAGRTERQQEEFGCYYRQQPFVFKNAPLKGGQTLAAFWEQLKECQRASKPFSGLSAHAQARLTPPQPIGFMYNYNAYITQIDALYGSEPGHQQGFIPRIEDAVQFYVKNVAEDMHVNLVYPDGIFADDRLLARFMSIARQLCAHDCSTLSNVDFILPDEALQLAGWECGHGDSSSGADRLAQTRPAFDVLALFSSQVRTNGKRIAVTDEAVELSYDALDAQSTALARNLLEQHVKPGDKVALLLPRDHRFAIAMLAVAKVSACYVPLDPGHPQKRIDFILDDAGVALVVTCEQLNGLVGAERRAVVLWEDVLEALEQALASPVPQLPPPPSDPERDFYVIYTSGTTGHPKGVVVSAGNVAQLFHGCERLFDFASTDAWSVCHSFAFDFSVWELWGPLITGARACVVDAATIKDSPRFHGWLRENEISVMSQTPSAFLALELTDRRQADEPLKHLRYVVFGGEALDINHLHAWRSRYALGKPALINMYGITEITVHATFHALTQADFDASRNTIGKALPHLTSVVLDEDLRRLPPGFPGELFIVGRGVAKGYLHREALTKERFLPLPQLGHGEACFYRSGDRVRYLPDGSLQYLGRNDRQVKIRGYRIELDEIENVLRSCDGVGAGAVKVVDFGAPIGQRLVAYVCHDREGVPDLVPAMQARLPHYMVPSNFVALPHLPLTDNGKINYRALPLPDLRAQTEESLALETPTQIRLAQLMGELLQQRVESRMANFFALGGHSLLATQFASRIEQQFNVEMPLRSVFQHGRLHELASDIDRRSLRLACGDGGRMAHPDVAVPLSDPGHPDKLFCIHSGTGDAFSYSALAEKLAPEFSVWGIQVPGYEANGASIDTDSSTPLALQSFDSFAMLARHYCDAMTQIQQEGPYRIMGWSSGGLLALEAARLLQERGERVDFVGMVDTLVPDPGRFDYTLAGLMELQDHSGETLGQHVPALQEGVMGTQQGQSVAQINKLIRIAKCLRRWEGAHMPVMPAGSVHMFVAEDPSAVKGADWLTPGWTALNGDDLRMYTVPGNHFTVLDRDHAGGFAKLLLDILNQAPVTASHKNSVTGPAQAFLPNPAAEPANPAIDAL